MTAFEQASLNANGRGLQLYLGVELVHDSAFPLAASDDVFVHPVGDIGFFVLDTSALRRAYPLSVDQPPEPLREPPENASDGILGRLNSKRTNHD